MHIDDIGEINLLEKYIFPIIKDNYAGNIGDDAANLEIEGVDLSIIVTTDGPIKPMVNLLGSDDYYYYGWLNVVVNVSDLAAVAAKPLCYSSSIMLPEKMQVEDVQRLFEGINDACKEYNIKNAGGNIKRAERVECHGTAVGIAGKNRKISRSTCKEDDIIVSIGSINGLFGHCLLKAQKFGLKSLDEKEFECLSRPRAKVKEMMLLGEKNFLSAATDNSDGILGSIQNICRASNCSVYLDLDLNSISQIVKDASKNNDLNPFNLFFFWGDWQIISSIHQEKWEDFKKFCHNNKILFTRLGFAKKGDGSIFGKTADGFSKMKILRNENFTSNSFNSNYERNINYLLKENLFY